MSAVDKPFSSECNGIHLTLKSPKGNEMQELGLVMGSFTYPEQFSCSALRAFKYPALTLISMNYV